MEFRIDTRMNDGSVKRQSFGSAYFVRKYIEHYEKNRAGQYSAMFVLKRDDSLRRDAGFALVARRYNRDENGNEVKDQLFIDCDFDDVLSVSELEWLFMMGKENGEIADPYTFSEWLNGCMDYNNGTLHRMEA